MKKTDIINKHVIKKINKAEVISFDIFDTLIKRNLSRPTQLFDFVEKEYNKRFPDNCISGFREKRIAGEKEARSRVPGQEVSLKDIYDCIAGVGESKEKRELQALELQEEIRFCEPNRYGVELFDLCKKLSKRIVFISDMYLPRDTIESMLNKCEIRGYEKLYLSSEIGIQKKDGKLYEYAINDMSVEPSCIVHIGDNKKTDILMARVKGLKSIHIDHFHSYMSFATQDDLRKTTDVVLPFINNNISKYSEETDEFRWGYEALGPLLVGFCNWIHEYSEQKNYDRLFFLARDMYLFIKVYRLYYPEDVERISYLELSRRSMRRAYVLQKDNLFAVFDTMPRGKYTMSEVVSSVGLKWEDLVNHDAVRMKQVAPDESISSFEQPSISFCILSSIVISLLRNTDDYAVSYLEQEGFLGAGKHAIVDIGWHASTQNMLEVICEKPVTGLYFGNSKRNTFSEMEMYGYWYNVEDEKQALPFISMTYILETMLFAKIGSTISYRNEAGRILPVYNTCENSDFDIIGRFQTGAMKFASDYYSFFGNTQPIKKEDAIRGIVELAFRPSLEQAKVFADLSYEDGKISNMGKAKKTSYYCFHPKAFLTDYASAKWKEGFIKQMNPRLKNPHRIDGIVKTINDKRRSMKIKDADNRKK